jgi:folate-dependent phosphoribosylglycinamide formyltransferase PurN
MKILTLYSQSIANDYVISNLLRKPFHIMTIREEQGSAQVVKRTFKRKKHSLPSKINRLLFYLYFFLFLSSKVKRLFKKKLDFTRRLEPDHKVKNINDDRTLELAKEFSPDIILVFGTSLLKKGWFELQRPILNSHLGIIPRYRGWLCWFWSVLEENFDSVGISIHHVTKIADGGAIVIQDFLNIFELEKIDLPHILFSVILLVEKNISRAINMVSQEERSVYDFNEYRYGKKYPHYFEPGITDYLKFVSLTKRLNRRIK